MQVASRLEDILHYPPRSGLFAVCVLLVAAIAVLDYVTGHELSLSVLYLAPIFLAAWILGRDAGVTVSMMATVTWLVSAFFMGLSYSHPFYYFWDAAITFVTFALFALLISRLRIALEHADERFITVLEGLDSAVFVTDERDALLYANEQFHRSFGAGIPFLEAVRAGVNPADTPKDTSLLQPGAREGEFHDAERHRWYLLRTRTVRWIDGRSVRLHRANDITERKQAEELARQQQEKLQMTSRLISIGEMASTLAHELNQPLAAIANYAKGCVRRLRSGKWEAAELLAALEKTSAQAERAGRIVQRVRGFVSKREPVFVACDLNEVIEGVASLIEIEAETNAVEVTADLARDLPRVRADPVMIEQVVLNLVKNAIEAMQQTSLARRRLTIRSASRGPDAVEVEVSDTGPGIPPDFDERSTAPFFTTKEQGMGLGLHICRSILEMHGGHLGANRNASGGATFFFSLPRHGDEE